MKEKFSAWLDELVEESKPEVWCISKGAFGKDEPSIAEWVEFVNQAFEARASMIPKGATWTSYLWHDEQASQLRFASSPCDPDNLPFSATVELLDGPEMIVASWLRDDDHIPWSDLEDVDFEPPESVESSSVRVWALRHGWQE